MVAELAEQVSNNSYSQEMEWKKYYIFDEFMAAEVSREMLSKVGHNRYVDEVEKELKGAYNINMFLFSEHICLLTYSFSARNMLRA